ncbi:ExbD/TolR family protein, partial [Candidatus Skiveiella danica]
ATQGKLTRATLVNRVLELQKVKDRPVVIAADRNVKYDEVVGLLGALHAQGVKRVGLVAKEGG